MIMPSTFLVLYRSTRIVPEGLLITFTIKDGESWRKIDQILVQRDWKRIANEPNHEITIEG